jgi:succinyl-diaminopimelate desuccinylase
MSQLKQNLLDEIVSLLSIPSETKDPKDLEKVIHQAKKALSGFSVELFEGQYPSLLAYAGPTRPDTFDILLNGHLDVVPGQPAQYVPRREGDFLYARGALDMKAAAWIMLDVFRNTALSSNKKIGLQIVTDEEMGGRAGTKTQIDAGVRAKFVIGGEYTNLKVATAAKGICTFSVEFSGVAAHSAYPWEGDNAIHKLIKVLGILQEKYPTPKPNDFWHTTLNVNLIHSPNKADNVMPALASATIDVRYIPEDPIFGKGFDAVKSYFLQLDPGVEVSQIMYEPSHKTDAKDLFTLDLLSSIKIHTGIPAKTVRKNGGSDLRYYSEIGIPCVLFGPTGEGIHRNDEYVSIKSLEVYRKILSDFIKD